MISGHALRLAKLVLAVTILALAGCISPVPSAFYPKQEMFGLVLDQDGLPMANVRLVVDDFYPYWFPGMFSSMRTSEIWTDSAGVWYYAVRKAYRTVVGPCPPRDFMVDKTKARWLYEHRAHESEVVPYVFWLKHEPGYQFRAHRCHGNRPE